MLLREPLAYYKEDGQYLGVDHLIQSKTQCWIISACALLHNHIKREMAVDPQKQLPSFDNLVAQELDGEHIMYVETSDAWTEWRDNLAKEMFDQWRASRRGS
jgi:hypothetical protein